MQYYQQTLDSLSQLLSHYPQNSFVRLTRSQLIFQFLLSDEIKDVKTNPQRFFKRLYRNY